MLDSYRSNNVSFGSRAAAVELQHLRCAIAAADCGSLRQAADLLRVRQSTLSRSIRQLEHSIGAIVFERSSGGVKPTASGRGFLRSARVILKQMDALVHSLRSDGQGHSGSLAIGFCTSLSAGNLRASLLELKQKYPKIELLVAERSRDNLMTALRNGTIDVLVVTGDTPRLGHKAVSLWSERILVALPEDHPLAARDVVYWTDLRAETVLLSQYDSGRELEDVLISKLVSPDARPRIERHDVSRSIIKSLISMRLGLSLVMESDVGARFPGLIYRELRDGTGPSRIGFSAVWRADNESPALQRFLALLAERYPSTDLGE